MRLVTFSTFVRFQRVVHIKITKKKESNFVPNVQIFLDISDHCSRSSLGATTKYDLGNKFIRSIRIRTKY